MSARGVEDIKIEICRLLKRAAQCKEIEGDEPLVVLWTSMAKMVSEISDDTSRKAFAGAVANSFESMVNMYREFTNAKVDADEFLSNLADEFLH